MAVAEMSKLNLVAMSYDRDKLLNALQRTGATEIKLQKETENTVPATADCENLRDYLIKAETALDYLSQETAAMEKENKIKTDNFDDGFAVSYSEFMSAGDKKEEADELVGEIQALSADKKALASELNKIRRTIASAKIYSGLQSPLNSYTDTLHTKIRLGTVPAAAAETLLKAAKEVELCEVTVLNADTDNVLIVFAAHKSADGAEELLQNAGFSACPFASAQSGALFFTSLCVEEQRIVSKIEENVSALYTLYERVKPLKVYCDYVRYELEKAELAEKMRETATCFLLEAYVPTESRETVKAALDEVTEAAYYEFTEPDEDEVPPTLYKNKPIAKNFEAITNMYSPVNSREFDPNTIMAFFYSVFLGFIMGDIGYGLIMLLGGGLVYFKNFEKEGGLKSLAGVFAVGGICAILWGILFNSFFGISLPFIPTVMPDAQGDMWTFIGISIPAVLIISLELGIVQLCAGYICRAVQCWRRNKFWDGVWDGVVWAVFSLGAGLAIIGLIEEANVPLLAYIGGVIAGVSLVTAMLTAGRKEKLLGKFTKGFGAAYGIINYASDVLSYARLYGLMLSGAVIAQIISTYSIEFITGGNALYAILGVVLMVVGHVFNLAIGLLGAYIHDARLQYVEFYGRFYEGEGKLFTPVGSQHKYIQVVS